MEWYKDGIVDGLWLLSNAELWCQIMRVINNRRAFLKLSLVSWTYASKPLGYWPTEATFLTIANNSSSTCVKEDLSTLWNTITSSLEEVGGKCLSHATDTYPYVSHYNPWKNADWSAKSDLTLSSDIEKWWSVDRFEEVRTKLKGLIYAEKLKCSVGHRTFQTAKKRKILGNNTLSNANISYLNTLYAGFYGHSYSPSTGWKCLFKFETTPGTGLTSNISTVNTLGTAENIGAPDNFSLPDFAYRLRTQPFYVYPEVFDRASNYTGNPSDVKNLVWASQLRSIEDAIGQFEITPSPEYQSNVFSLKYDSFPSGATFYRLKYDESVTYKFTFRVNYTNIFDEVQIVAYPYQYVNEDYISGWEVTNMFPEGATPPGLISAALGSDFNNFTIIPNTFTGFSHSIDLNPDIKEPPEMLFLLKYSYKSDINTWFQKETKPYDIVNTITQIVPNFNRKTGGLGGAEDIDFSMSNSFLTTPAEAVQASSAPNDSATIMP